MNDQVTSSTKWLKLNPDRIAPFVHPKDAPWSLSSPSPYNVPTKVRAEYSTQSGCLTIEFQYITEEGADEVLISPYFRVSVGRTTRRIFSISFDVHQFQRDRKLIERQAIASIDSLSVDEVTNGPIVARAFSEKSNDLLQVAAP